MNKSSSGCVDPPIIGCPDLSGVFAQNGIATAVTMGVARRDRIASRKSCTADPRQHFERTQPVAVEESDFENRVAFNWSSTTRRAPLLLSLLCGAAPGNVERLLKDRER